jgi:hypothetical protein
MSRSLDAINTFMISRMEILKSHPIIDDNYKPSLEMDYQEYFNRAMVFAQTNYQEHLTKLANIHFRKLSPTAFFEEYAWCVCGVGFNAKSVAKFFPRLSKELAPFYRSFWDLNNFPKREEVIENILPLIHNEQKCQALWRGGQIINQGIKLYGWDRYRDNFLSTTTKLQVLPMIGISNSFQLGRNIGFKQPICAGGPHLIRMATRWGFESPEQMCIAISKHVVLQPRVIGQILWYAGSHFGTNISEA